MTKQEHIQYWIEIANHDREVSQALFKAGHYDWSLFLAHLVVEKWLKALWVKNHKTNEPPRIHRLDLLVEAAGLKTDEPTLLYLRSANQFHREARYPDLNRAFQKKCTKKFAKLHLDRIEEIVKWLKSQLES